jgi:EAL domain-containing protein (putative c-di-GMP-specific phosphodiesterase class I)
MRGRDWLVIVGLAVFVLAAIMFGALAVSNWQNQNYAVTGAIIVLAIGQVFLLAVVWSRNAALANRLELQGRSLRALSDDLRRLAERLGDAERQISDAPGEAVASEVQDLRHSFQSLAEEIERTRDRIESGIQARTQAPPSEPELVPQPAALALDTPRERLELSLEPVIELSNDLTAHYRAQLSLVEGPGREVPHAVLIAKADDGGFRPAIDFVMLKQALPVLRRLHAKNPRLRIFVPLGLSSLNGAADLDRLVILMEESADVAGGIVLEIEHGNLGSLSATGIDGLARLARLGVTLALTGVSTSGLDLAALRQLGVRFLDIEASSFETGLGLSPAWLQFSQFARAMQFQIVAGGVTTAAQAAAAGQMARFGRGAFFAPPRRVKPDAGIDAGANDRIAAA